MEDENCFYINSIHGDQFKFPGKGAHRYLNTIATLMEQNDEKFSIIKDFKCNTFFNCWCLKEKKI